jgi:hypothetical protein
LSSPPSSSCAVMHHHGITDALKQQRGEEGGEGG